MTFCNFQASALVGKARRGKQWGKQIGGSAESPAMARRKLTAVRFIGFDRHVDPQDAVQRFASATRASAPIPAARRNGCSVICQPTIGAGNSALH
jgi:hypothetical protein